MTDTPESLSSGGEKNDDLFTLWSPLPGALRQTGLRVRELSVAGWRMYLEFERWRVNCPRCGSVHVEHLEWLAKNPRYTQRFTLHVGKLCRDMPNQAVAEMERLPCTFTD